MNSLDLWKKLLKLKIRHFTDVSNKLVWTFYKNDLEKLLKPKPLTKTQRKQHQRMLDGVVEDLEKLKKGGEDEKAN